MIRLAYNKGTQTLVLTDRIELCGQTLKAISHHKINMQVMDAKNKSFFPSAPVTLAMSETIKRRMTKWPAGYYSPKLIIADEAHKQSFNSILDAFPDAVVIGATATPKSKSLHRYYSDIVNNIDIPELIDQGFLSPCRAYMMQDDFSDVKIKAGEYENKSLFKHFDKSVLYKGVVKSYLEKTPGKKAVCFCVNIKHADKTNEEFRKEGVRSEVVTSETPAQERKRILDDFENGKFDVIVNCGILTTGWDSPAVEVAIVHRATKSVQLWLQMCGRAARIFPGKTHWTVLDHGNNHLEHDRWDAPREWSLAPPIKKKKGPAPVRTCPKCSALLPASARSCEFCNHIFPPLTKEEREGVMVEVQNKVPEELRGKRISELTIPQLVALSKSGAVSKPFIWRVVRSKGAQAVDDYGWKVGYRGGWATNQLKEMEDVRYRDRVL